MVSNEDPDSVKINVTKMDAVRRQLRTAIRLWFEDGDPVAIHTLVAASHEVLHTLFRRKGLHGLIFDSELIQDERRAEWSRGIRSSAVFFKHARADPDDIFEFWPFLNEMMIVQSISALERMGEKWGLEEEALIHWSYINRPGFLKEDPYRLIPIEVVQSLRGVNKKEFFKKYTVARIERMMGG